MPSMMVLACNPSTREVVVGRLGVQSQLVYSRPRLKKKKMNRNKAPGEERTTKPRQSLRITRSRVGPGNPAHPSLQVDANDAGLGLCAGGRGACHSILRQSRCFCGVASLLPPVHAPWEFTSGGRACKASICACRTSSPTP